MCWKLLCIRCVGSCVFFFPMCCNLCASVSHNDEPSSLCVTLHYNLHYDQLAVLYSVTVINMKKDGSSNNISDLCLEVPTSNHNMTEDFCDFSQFLHINSGYCSPYPLQFINHCHPITDNYGVWYLLTVSLNKLKINNNSNHCAYISNCYALSGRCRHFFLHFCIHTFPEAHLASH